MSKQDDKLPEPGVPDSVPEPEAPVTSAARGLPMRLLRRIGQLGICLLVVLAVYMTAGRLLMPAVAGQATNIEAQLTRLMGTPVSIGELHGTWFRFSPSLEITDLAIATDTAAGPEVHVVERAFVTLDAVRSLASRQPVISRVIVAGLQLALQERDDGTWAVAGIADSGGPGYTEQMFDFLLGTRSIAVSESSLLLRRANGAELAFDSMSLQLQNDGDVHELELQFRIAGQAEPSHLQVNMRGDPRSFYTASAFAAIDAAELAPVLDIYSGEAWQLQSLLGSGKFWLDLDSNGIQQVRATVDGLQLLAQAADAGQDIDLRDASFTLAARPVTDGESTSAWDLQLSDLSLDWQQTPWSVPLVQLSMPLSAAAPLTVQAAALDLGMLSQIAASALPLPARADEILATLAPQGMLRNVHLQTARDGSYPGGFLLRANMDAVAVSAWNAAPAGSGLAGYLQMEAGKGFAEVDSRDLTLHLPRLFDQAWHYDQLNTRVQWEYSGRDYRISSTVIDVANSSLKGKVQFDLLSTPTPQGVRATELSVLVGMEAMDIGPRSAYLPLIPRLGNTMDWLRTALQGGQLRDSGFVLRTSTPAAAYPGSTTFATWYEVSGGRLQFLPDWPALEDVTGSVRVRDGVVEVNTESASIGGVALDAATATVVPEAGGGSLLSVRGSASTATEQGLAFLRNTPVRAAIGPFLDNWEASGAVHADIALSFPLGASTTQRAIAVDVQSTASQLYIPDYSLAVNDINGRISWDNANGLSADTLTAAMFDFPIVASIATTADAVTGSRNTLISSTGRASVAALQAWPGQPGIVRDTLDFMTGEIAYSAELRLLPQDTPGGIRTSLDLRSDLLGMQSTLPLPFTKAATEAAALEMKLDFLADERLLTARYGDFMSAQIVLGADGIDRGQLYFGDRNRTFNVRQADADAPGLLINGELPYFDYAEWQAVVDALAVAPDSGQRSLADYLRLVDINLGTLVIMGQQLEDINVQVTYSQNAWHLQGMSALLGGRFTLPARQGDNLPWLVDLDYLRFPPRAEPEPAAEGEEVAPARADLLAAVDPTLLPAVDFSTAELSVGEQNLGAFSFSLRPNSNGTTISAFRMESPDASISDMRQTGGANIDWRFHDGMHTSSFNGLMAAGNLATVLPAWGHDANVESASARFSGTLQWSGSPLAFALKDSSGQILMDITRGRFVNIESSSSRLFGALNFDSLVRRLQLDFSDLFQRGFAFDRISGNLNFNNGLVTTNGAVLIEGPSSRISINGEIDLADETIAADMQVQIPLGQNISMLAGLLGAWPIALSTYVASKIFQEQVEDFATIIYRLEGPWDNPDAGFEPPPEATSENP